MWKGAGMMLLALAGGAVRAQTSIVSFTTSPSSVSFAAVDPAASPAPVSVSAQWRLSGASFQPWSLTVQSASATVGNCPKVPVSAFRAACVAVENPAGGSGGCSGGTLTLTTSPQTLASGTEGSKSSRTTVTLQVSFVDSWRYPGALSPGCSLNLTYVLNAQ